MPTVVMSIEGVLTDSRADSNILSHDASVSGRVMYQMIRDGSRVLLLSSDHSKDRVKAWLARERFTRYADVHCYPEDSPLGAEAWKVKHIKDLAAAGHHIAFYIDSNPNTIGAALEAGVNALLVAFTGSNMGQGASEHTYSPWYSLVETIEQQGLLRASKSLFEENGDG